MSNFVRRAKIDLMTKSVGLKCLATQQARRGKRWLAAGLCLRRSRKPRGCECLNAPSPPLHYITPRRPGPISSRISLVFRSVCFVPAAITFSFFSFPGAISGTDWRLGCRTPLQTQERILCASKPTPWTWHGSVKRLPLQLWRNRQQILQPQYTPIKIQSRKAPIRCNSINPFWSAGAINLIDVARLRAPRLCPRPASTGQFWFPRGTAAAQA